MYENIYIYIYVYRVYSFDRRFWLIEPPVLDRDYPFLLILKPPVLGGYTLCFCFYVLNNYSMSISHSIPIQSTFEMLKSPFILLDASGFHPQLYTYRINPNQNWLWKKDSHTHRYIAVYMYIYIYTWICICIGLYRYTYITTKKYTYHYIPIYIYIYLCIPFKHFTPPNFGLLKSLHQRSRQASSSCSCIHRMAFSRESPRVQRWQALMAAWHAPWGTWTLHETNYEPSIPWVTNLVTAMRASTSNDYVTMTRKNLYPYNASGLVVILERHTIIILLGLALITTWACVAVPTMTSTKKGFRRATGVSRGCNFLESTAWLQPICIISSSQKKAGKWLDFQTFRDPMSRVECERCNKNGVSLVPQLWGAKSRVFISHNMS